MRKITGNLENEKWPSSNGILADAISISGGTPKSTVPAIMEFTIGWICALPSEKMAAVVMLDEKYPYVPRDPRGSVLFTRGRIGAHNVVMACLPIGRTRISSGTSVATEMRLKIHNLKLALMVGIGGGVPSAEDDIRLGDVVVSAPDAKFGGVVQYDFEKSEEGGKFRQTGHLDDPPMFLLSVLGMAECNRILGEGKIQIHMARSFANEGMRDFTLPQHKQDMLFQRTSPHIGGSSDCASCDQDQIIQRPNRDISSTTVKIHCGIIASGNQVMEDAQKREDIVERLGGRILCFEMEAASVMNEIPCLVVRDISDYCDSHKNDGWQKYAAASAAAYTRTATYNAPTDSLRIDELVRYDDGLDSIFVSWHFCSCYFAVLPDLRQR
jgi:nucleoside phosphorylase